MNTNFLKDNNIGTVTYPLSTLLASGGFVDAFLPVISLKRQKGTLHITMRCITMVPAVVPAPLPGPPGPHHMGPPHMGPPGPPHMGPPGPPHMGPPGPHHMGPPGPPHMGPPGPPHMGPPGPPHRY